MVITGGPPHKPVAAWFTDTDVVGADVTAVGDAACRSLMDISGVVANRSGEAESGVHVGGMMNGVTVGICRVGPRGLCQAPEYSQKTNPKTATARTASKARINFWNDVILCARKIY
jgi:hypothetical protein